MSREAPLQVTVEIRLLDGPAAGERRFRLSRQVELPAALSFEQALPVEGEARADIAFQLPDGARITSRAWVGCDPEHPEQGSTARLHDPAPQALQALETYINDYLARTTP